jgi:hypothetical protein
MDNEYACPTIIYILLCDEQKYYIGRTNNLIKRLKEHISGNGSEWTKKYKPIKPIQIIKYTSPFDEDKYTLIYMSKYGIENVRGGTFSSSSLKDDEKIILAKIMIYKTSPSNCLSPNQSAHFELLRIDEAVSIAIGIRE